MKLFGKVVSCHLGHEYPDRHERVTINLQHENGRPYAGPIAHNVLTLINEGNWKLGQELEIELTVSKAKTIARAATA
jgi:hypothetical protein